MLEHLRELLQLGKLKPNPVSSTHLPFTLLHFSLTALSVSNLITPKLTYIVLTLSLPCLGPPTHHGAASTRPWEQRGTCLLTTGCDSGRILWVLVGLCLCVCDSAFSSFCSSMCLGCGDLYGVLVTPCVISISVMSISIAWGDWRVASQMVQCQGPWVCLEDGEYLLCGCPNSVTMCPAPNRVPRQRLILLYLDGAPSLSVYFLFFFSFFCTAAVNCMRINASLKPQPNPVIPFLQQPARDEGRSPKSRQPRELCGACPCRCQCELSWNTIGV